MIAIQENLIADLTQRISLLGKENSRVVALLEPKPRRCESISSSETS
jgi:hypothetical protein